jgi:hypothetical protein
VLTRIRLHCCRWFSSALGATSESYADALERFCAAPPKHLLLTQQSSAAAADLAATLTALQAPAGADVSSKKHRKRQLQLQQELLDKQLVVAQSKMAQVDPQGATGRLVDFAWRTSHACTALGCIVWIDGAGPSRVIGCNFAVPLWM